MVDLESFYSNLAGAEVLPAAVQSMMTSWMRTNPALADQLLVRLSHRADLVEPVLELLRGSTSAKVKAAYLSMPTLGTDVLEAALKRERRATVLAAVAAQEHASARLLERLAATPSPSVVLAVLRNPALGSAGARTAAMFFDDREPGYDVLEVIRAALAQRPEAAGSVALASSNTLVLDLLTGLPLSPAALARLADRLVFERARITAGPGLPSWERSTLCRALSVSAADLLKNPALPGPLAVRIATSVQPLMATRGLNHPDLPGLVRLFTSSEADRVAADLAAAARNGRLVEAPVADTARIEELLTFLPEYAPERFGRNSLACELATNPALTTDHAAVLLPHLDSAALAALFERPGAAWASLMARSVLTSSFAFERLLHSASVAYVDAFFSAFTSALANDVPPDFRTHAITRVLGLSLLTFERFAALPWKETAGAAHLAGFQVELLSQLGDDPVVLDTFNVLAADFEGSASDLVDAVRAVA